MTKSQMTVDSTVEQTVDCINGSVGQTIDCINRSVGQTIGCINRSVDQWTLSCCLKRTANLGSITDDIDRNGTKQRDSKHIFSPSVVYLAKMPAFENLERMGRERYHFVSGSLCL